MQYTPENEPVIYRTGIHWGIFILPAFLFVVSVALLGNREPSIKMMGTLILLAFFLPTLIAALLYKLTTTFTLTDRRVHIKTGLIARHTLETLLPKIEGIEVSQGIFGRIFGYGTVVITGTGGSHRPFKGIENPMEFRRQVQEQLS